MKGRSGGFTVTEMLTVVGILAVTMAVAIPSVIALRADLKMRELDDTAREIFLAAQNSMTARKAAGVSLKLGEEDGGTGEDGNADGPYWLSSDDPDMKTLLPPGSVESVAAGNYCMIWYNAGTAAVREVYYAEGPLDADKIKAHTYSDIYNTSHKPARREARIGYYNGSDLDRGDVESLAPPLLTIKNENELTVTVIVPNALEYVPAGIRLTVTVEELNPDGTASGNKHVFSGNDTIYPGGTLELLLDSLTRGHFKDICKNISGGNITPGANIRVTATLSGPAGGKKTYLSASAHADSNSLFSGRTTKDGRDTLSIACARHLQNLEPAASGLPHSANVKPAYFAVQTAEIPWPAGTDFQPICNRSLRGYHGHGNEITKLQITCDSAAKVDGSSGAGLFAFVEKASLRNIRLVDPVLTGTDPAGAEYVGALAGILRESNVSDCQVYATGRTTGIDCAGHAGGLVGLAQDDYTITGSSASLPGIRSALNGAYIGGLIGYAKISSGYTTGSVKECYANTGWMGEDKKWGLDSGMTGTSAAIGGLIGGTWNTSGIIQASDCYALGWFSGGRGGALVGELVNGVTVISNCYSILQSRSGNHYYVNQDTISSLSELSRFTWSGTIAKGGTTAYNAGVCTGDYPYPMLNLRHYGDWPVQTVDGIKLYKNADDPEGNHAQFIMAPAGSREVTFFAEARNGGSSAMEAIAAGENGPGIKKVKVEYDKTTGRSQVTLAFPKPPRVSYVDLTAGGYTLRTLVLLYKADVTLNGENSGDHTTAISTASSDGTKQVDTLTLSGNAKEGIFTAGLEVQPGVEKIKTNVNAWETEAGTGDPFQVSISAKEIDDHFAGWDKLRSGDPAVTANGDPGAGTNILDPVSGSYYPEAGPDGTLTVTGAASGTATVSACWAMDETLKADCEVKMAGARALIWMASASGERGRTLGEKSGYPYRLDLLAEPGEQIDLTFTPRLFGGQSSEDGTYAWAIDGKDIGTTSPADQNHGAWTYPLTDDRPRAAYTVTLTYANSSGEKSMDFMTFSVYRAASKDVSDYQVIKLYNRGDRTEISGGEAGQVEQLHSPDCPHVDTLLLEGYVKGAENTRVRWYARAKAGADLPENPWMPVTGIVGSQTVEDENGVARAKVEWVTDEIAGEKYNLLSVDGKTPTGGAILVTGLDVNEYGEVFALELKAEAMESAGAGEAPSCRIVTVKVMPRLEITPKAKTVVDYRWNKPTVRFQANREVGTYPFVWKEEVDGVTTVKTEDGSAAQQIDGVDDTTVTVICKYGPFTATATLTWLWMLDDLAAPINADYIISGTTAAQNTEYFILEKGETRELELTWGCPISYDIRKTPSGTEHIDIQKHSGSDTTNILNPVGHRTYKVTGNEYTGDKVESLTWVIGGLTSLTRWDFPKYFAVVGMEINGSHSLVLQKDQTVQLSAVASFADVLKNSESLTWESDYPELVSVYQDEDGVWRARAEKNGAATYSATITATYTVECKNGKTYTFKDYVTVKVQPEGKMEVTLEPCTTGDLTALNQVFPDANLTASSVLVPVDRENKWTLIRSGDFGLNSMYLKAAATLNGEQLDDLKDYIGRVSGDASYLSIETRESGGALYIRVQAKAANVDVTEVDLIAEIGTASTERAVYVYDAPSVRLTRNNDQGGAEDVTNSSRPVYLNETDLSVTLTAALEPTLYGSEDRDKTSPLNTIEWVLEASAGYEPDRYLELVPEKNDPNTVTVRLKPEGRMPDFRVVIRARGREGGAADAGYALVFLPEEKSEQL